MAIENARLPIVGNVPRGRTERKDCWWAQPLATFIVFTSFVVYVTWRTFENNFYNTLKYWPQYLHKFGPHYLSPLYSPTFDLHLGGFAISPALWILPFPLFFRATCYYYRKAYYRAYFWDPVACAVDEVASRKHYTGEREFPFILQNLHRYAFYFAAIIMAILWWDAFDAFRMTDVNGGVHFFVGVGSLVFLINVVLLSMYTFSCHSWRHLLGGCINCFSCSSTSKTRHGIWERVSHLNENHALWAWLSLFSVALAGLYVRLVASGAITDLRLI